MRRVLLLLGLLLLLVPAAAGDDDPPPPALRFAEKSLDFTLEELQGDGVPFEVLNDRAREVPARLRLSEMTLRGVDERTIPTARAITFPGGRFLVPPGSSRKQRLRARDDLKLEDGTYKGQFAVYEPDVGVVSRVPVTLTVGEPTLSTKPAVEKLSADDDIAPLGSGDETEVTIPLASLPAGTAAKKPEVAGKSVGVLTDGEGNTARVVAGDAVRTIDGGTPAISLDVKDLDGVGTYTGKIDLLPAADDAGTVELTVDRGHAWGWFLLPLLPGILIALWARRWKTTGFELLGLDDRLTSAHADYDAAAKAFAERATDRPWRWYDTSEAFAAQIAEARKHLERLTRQSYDELGEAEKKALVKELDAVDAHVKALSGLADALEGLGEALAAVDDPPIAALLPPDPDDRPRFVRDAQQELLTGTTLSGAGLAERVAAIEHTTTLAELWGDLRDEAYKHAQRLREAREKATEEERKLIDDAHRSLSSAWTQMWEARDAETIRERKLVEALVAAIGKAAQATPLLRREGRPPPLAGPQEETGGRERLLASAQLVGWPPTPADVVTGGPADPTQRLVYLAEARGRIGAVLFAAAMSGAILTAYAALYDGNTWGGARDYLAALLWGLGATVALDAVADAVRSVVEGRRSARNA